MTDADGELYEHIEYFPFGETWVEEQANTIQRVPYRYTSKELDEETGLYYYGARYYDPRTSVWQSPDPILGDYLPSAKEMSIAKERGEKYSPEKSLRGMGGVFRSHNLGLYNYSFSNPVLFFDPDGNEGMNGGARRSAARQARAARGTTTMPEIKPGVYPIIVDSGSITATPLSIEVGDIYVIDKANKKVLHYAYVGGGPGAGYDAVASRELGAVYLSDAGAVEGFAISGESDGVLGIGGTGTLAIPTIPLTPRSTSVSGGAGVGVGAGISAIGTVAWFQKAYDFSEAPPLLPDLSKYLKQQELNE